MLEINQLETKRFAFPCGGVTDVAAVLANPRRFSDSVSAEGMRLITARVSAEHLERVQGLEAIGFRLMDTLVYYGRPLNDIPQLPMLSGVVVRHAERSDVAAVEAVAQAAFSGYLGHYHQDPNLDPASCNAIYSDWARRSVEASTDADPVLVAQSAAGIVGFLTLKTRPSGLAEIVLNAVAPDQQRSGIYSALCCHAFDLAMNMNLLKVQISTQLANYHVQRVWSRLGCALTDSYYTLHFWPK